MDGCVRGVRDVRRLGPTAEQLGEIESTILIDLHLGHRIDETNLSKSCPSFKKALDSKKHAAAVDADMALGKSVNVNGRRNNDGWRN